MPATCSVTLYSTRDGRISPTPDGAVMLRGYAAKFAVILVVRRRGPVRPGQVVEDLEARSVFVVGNRPVEVVRSIMKRESGQQRNRVRTTTLVEVGMGLFRFREHSIAPSTMRRWEQRFPTIV
jgi:hypothetical protein